MNLKPEAAPHTLSSRAEHERPKDGHAQSRDPCPSIPSNGPSGSPLGPRLFSVDAHRSAKNFVISDARAKRDRRNLLSAGT
jgi:hypothetical protein